MFSNILVPLDIDAEKTCADALALARELMEKHQSKLTLLHVNEVITGMVAAHLPADFAKEGGGNGAGEPQVGGSRRRFGRQGRLHRSVG